LDQAHTSAGEARAVATAFDPEDEYRPEAAPPPRPAAWKDGSRRIGIHTSIAGHVAGALEIAHRLGANALQIFSASPRMWPARPLAGARGESRSRFAPAEAAAFRARREELGLGPLAVHANYLINLASPERVLLARSVQAFHDELVRALALGADYVIVHPGAARGDDNRRALERAAGAIRQAARGLRLDGLRILLENTAGQGSALGMRFSELKAMLEACAGLPMGVCIDTAHLFAAGFDIRSEAGLDRTLYALDSTLGLERVFVVHANDSKAALGSRLDRHQHIGKGQIGLEAFRRILNHPALAAPVLPGSAQEGIIGRAFLLETPIDRPGDDARNVRTLWALVGAKVTPARASAPRLGKKQSSKLRPRASRG
jgi:deoxyribonuclease-4